MKFKVGDKVKIVAPWSDNKGLIGEVSSGNGLSWGFSIHVVIDETHDGWYESDELELIEPDDMPDDVIESLVSAAFEQPDVMFPAFQDNVNHPQHYKHGEIETLDIIRMSLTPEEFQGFLKGNVLKYQLRAPSKHETPEEDYKKAKYYYDEYREVAE